MTDLPQYTLTLNELINQQESTRDPADIPLIVEKLREQRERWNAEQAAGSRTLVKSSKITAKGPGKAPGSFKKGLAGLKL